MSGVSADWYAWKLFAHHATGWSMDALHVVAGVLLQLLFAALLRTSLRDRLPLALVLAIAVLNEVSDLMVERWPELAMQLGESAKDVALTMLLPSVLFLVARLQPRVLR